MHISPPRLIISSTWERWHECFDEQDIYVAENFILCLPQPNFKAEMRRDVLPKKKLPPYIFFIFVSSSDNNWDVRTYIFSFAMLLLCVFFFVWGCLPQKNCSHRPIPPQEWSNVTINVDTLSCTLSSLWKLNCFSWYIVENTDGEQEEETPFFFFKNETKSSAHKKKEGRSKKFKSAVLHKYNTAHDFFFSIQFTVFSEAELSHWVSQQKRKKKIAEVYTYQLIFDVCVCILYSHATYLCV